MWEKMYEVAGSLTRDGQVVVERADAILVSGHDESGHGWIRGSLIVLPQSGWEDVETGEHQFVASGLGPLDISLENLRSVHGRREADVVGVGDIA